MKTTKLVKDLKNKSIKPNKDDNMKEEDKKEGESAIAKNNQNLNENQGRDLYIRASIEVILLQTVWGNLIEGITGFLAWSSSLLYMIMTYYDDRLRWFDIIDVIL